MRDCPPISSSLGSEWAGVYRLRQEYRVLGIAGALLFGGMAIAALVDAYSRVTANPWPFVAGVSFALLTPFFLWMVWLFHRGRLQIDDRGYTQQGPLRSRRIDYEMVRRIHWSSQPAGGRVTVFTRHGKVSLELGCFERPASVALIRALRRSCGSVTQTGWEDFCHDVAVPALDPWTIDPAGKQTYPRRRVDVLMAVGFAVLLAGTALAFGWTGRWEALATPVLWLPVWLLTRFLTPRTAWETPLPDERQHWLRLGFVVGAASLVWLLSAWFPDALRMCVRGAGCAISLLAVCWISLRWSIFHQRQRAQAVPESVARWSCTFESPAP